MKAYINKNHFIGLDGRAYLYCGAEAPALAGAEEAVRQYMRHRSLGAEGRRHNSFVEQQLRDNVAALLNGRPEHIALLSSASEGIAAIANAVDWRNGDNVVVNALEYPSGVLPWLLLKDKGVELRVVDHIDWHVAAERMLERVDERTRLVVASHVSFLSGSRLDCRLLYEALKQTDTLLLLDATQSFGAVPVELNCADAIVCSSYKWLLGIHGLGLLAVNPARLSQLQPKAAGWRSVADKFAADRFRAYRFWDEAKRFELGFPGYASIHALHYATGLLRQYDAAAIERHIAELGGTLIGELQHRGYPVMTPSAPERRAGNISVQFEQGERLAHELERQGVHVWGGSGRFRVSVHAFNDANDIDALLEKLPPPPPAGRIKP